MKSTVMILLLSFITVNIFAQTNKHSVCKPDPNAVPAWPKSAYVPTGNPDCAPCYEYTRKSGIRTMECHHLWFAPEGSNTTRETNSTTQNGTREQLNVQREGSYGGNYPAVCKRDPGTPANAKPAWPKSAYIPTGNPSCAPCYEYTRKSGLKVMECHHLWFKE
jgi:hypothetical protein